MTLWAVPLIVAFCAAIIAGIASIIHDHKRAWWRETRDGDYLDFRPRIETRRKWR